MVCPVTSGHEQVVEVLNPLARELKSVGTLREQLANLQEELGRAHEQVVLAWNLQSVPLQHHYNPRDAYSWLFLSQVHLSEARVQHTLQKLATMEAALSNQLPQANVRNSPPPKARASVQEALPQGVENLIPAPEKKKGLNTSGPTAPYSAWLRNFWYPVAFSAALKENTMVICHRFLYGWMFSRLKEF